MGAGPRQQSLEQSHPRLYAPRCRLARRLSPPLSEVNAMPASNSDPSYLPAHRLAAEISSRRLSPVDVVEAFLARIAAHNEKLHAYIDVYADDVRLAASWCGLSGLKTTIGRVSTYGILPLAPSLDTPGPMARSVEDAALLYSVMPGPDPLDPRTLSAPTPHDVTAGLRRGVKGLRLARMPQGERDGCTPEMLAAYDAALDALGRLGAEIVDLALPCP